jgi:hypothetical protein
MISCIIEVLCAFLVNSVTEFGFYVLCTYVVLRFQFECEPCLIGENARPMYNLIFGCMFVEIFLLTT